MHTPDTAGKKPAVSVVVPVYNEEKNLPLLFTRLSDALSPVGLYEIVAVDDGSRDASAEVLKLIAKQDARVRVVRFKTNFGQTAPLSAGIEAARGSVIVTIDSDLENDPADILKLLTKMDEGYDVVSGWRQKRWAGSFLHASCHRSCRSTSLCNSASGRCISPRPRGARESTGVFLDGARTRH